MSAAANRALVERIYADFEAGDVAAVLAALAPDVEWIEAAGSPYGGTWRGPQQVLDAVFMKLGADWQRFDVEPAELVVDGGDAVVVMGTYRARHAASGRLFEAAFAHAWRLREGRIVRFRQYTDTALMLRAMA